MSVNKGVAKRKAQRAKNQAAKAASPARVRKQAAAQERAKTPAAK